MRLEYLLSRAGLSKAGSPPRTCIFLKIRNKKKTQEEKPKVAVTNRYRTIGSLKVIRKQLAVGNKS